ncbi:MAG: TraB/GumN family protein [Aliidiomarina sp.]|uniref:TraB/GumN family protein n=1 Tax=Aliidiomarina sp. TaxID=1872439 RepID=UPI0025BCB970|nr:TraB/GumN family protein [Aliidiomarina sp.]MCH8501422.1 TraB/GumN family protein [Aliidiomarina sp.]
MKMQLRMILLAVIGLLWMNSAQAEILYKAKFGEQTWWILGTIHVGEGEEMRLSERSIEAFLQSDKVWMELTPEEMERAAEVMLGNGVRSDNFFPQNLEEETWSALQQQLLAVGIPPMQVTSLEPWLLELMLIMQIAALEGFSPELGSESQLLAVAAEMQGELLGLETAQDQIEALMDAAVGSDEEQMVRLLEQLDKGVEQLQQMKMYWVNGDLDSLMSILVEDLDAAQLAAVLDQRNINWMETLRPYFGQSSGTYFIAVGAGHLGGETGLIPAFSAAGAEMTNYSSK